jgi:uncharacterized protein YbjT (DUF2867 family)
MKAIVIGSTGLVGSHLLNQLEKNTQFTEVIALVRKPVNSNLLKAQQVMMDFDNMDPECFHGDVLFCALGTTIKKAGSKSEQYKVDYTYNAEACRLAKLMGVKILAHVSSIGADSSSSNFYLRTKGELENTMRELRFDKSIIARPSIILGDRKEFRLGEKIGIVVSSILSPLMVGPLKKYKGVHASKIAAALLTEALNKETKGFQIIESDGIQNYS